MKSSMTVIGEWIESIYKKGAEESNIGKGFILAGLSGLLDGIISSSAILGIVVNICIILCSITKLFEKLFGEKS